MISLMNQIDQISIILREIIGVRILFSRGLRDTCGSLV
ncbi:hypothetical protein C7S14_3429 [Burkholderia cepacia]|nr:hypothetical protein C7S14_3429 [Burkholderia cepacia]